MPHLVSSDVRRVLTTTCAVAVLVHGAALPVSAQSTESIYLQPTQQVYLSVLDARQVPVTGLIPDEIEVAENGVARQVVYLGRAGDRADVTLIVDNTQSGRIEPVHLRDGLGAFVDAFGDPARLSLLTIADFPRRVAGPSSPADLRRTVGELFPEEQATPQLRDTLIAAARDILERRPERPSIVVVASVCSCSSLLGPRAERERLVGILQALNAPVHMVLLRTARSAVTGADAPVGGRAPGTWRPNIPDVNGNRRRRDWRHAWWAPMSSGPVACRGSYGNDWLETLEAITRGTGGRLVNVHARAGLDEPLRNIALDIQSRYTLTYLRSDLPLATEALDFRLRVARDDVTVRATFVR